MKKNLFYIPFLTLLLTAVTSCTSDGEDGGNGNTAVFTAVSNAPDWQSSLLEAMVSNDAKPDWKLADLSDYESFTVLVVKLDEGLVPRSNDDDVMAVFIDNECRAIPPRNVTDDGIVFVFNVRGSSTEGASEYRLSYYSGGLHQIFSLSETGGYLINEYILGTDKDFVLPLTYGTTKFSTRTACTVSIPSNAPFTPSEDDLVAAFIGNECRGVGKPGSIFTIYSNSSNEQVQLRYYSAEKQGVYSDPTPITLSDFGIDKEFNF